jgi:hypothetical protein
LEGLNMLYKTLDGTYCNDSTVTVPPSGAILLDDAAWESRLGAPIPYVVPPVTEVQMRQARLALLQAGYYDAVDNAINAMTGASGKAAKIEWQVSNTLRRNHPLVTTMGAMLGLSSAQLDALFTLANSL